MSSLTPLTATQYGNESALIHWQGVHLHRHLSEQRAFSKVGIALPSANLGGTLSVEWHAKHASLHQGMLAKCTPSLSYNLTQLAFGWKDAKTFQNWMRSHAVIHAHLDRQLGITV